MRFRFGKQDMTTLDRAQERCWLLTNGLGGFMSATAAFSVTRQDHGVLVAAEAPPGGRSNLVQRLSESLQAGGQAELLSTQVFADGTPPEEGFRRLSSFVWDGAPTWLYHVNGVQVKRQCAMAYGENVSAVLYTIENRTQTSCTLQVRPFCLPHVRHLNLQTSGTLTHTEPLGEQLSYPDDAQDGRIAESAVFSRWTITKEAPPGACVQLELVFSAAPTDWTGAALWTEQLCRQRELRIPFRDPVARQLAQSADAFITRRASTQGMTIVAGYPFFGDWGRDTMIALPGCLLSTGRYEEARSVLRTFLAYEKDGLVPNLFPEGAAKPRYNTADAALLLFHCVWQFWRRTGDLDFVWEAWPVLNRIAEAYQKGTRHAIGMDADGLIHAGAGLDQVTWMDVCVDGILPTPRHGKPVELNAYWYNALCILRELAPLVGAAAGPYAVLAERVKQSFAEAFWMEDRGYLKDVISGTAADEQLRCNQIWAVSMPFALLSPEQERRVVDVVYQALYTPCGLRTLSMADPEFHPVYAGVQRERDMAYHQGTVWPFPLGAYYLAYLKVHGNSRTAAQAVREQLEPLESMLREGCVGQLPEVYDGEQPGVSKGCFAQAWSVGELLRVYEALERIEKEEAYHAG